ncbi:MAG: hypothetical protein K2L11_03515, partial [Muribaculaceae bacterium]|nr:hypothetical protein [Muribaculaceae bacterium]
IHNRSLTIYLWTAFPHGGPRPDGPHRAVSKEPNLQLPVLNTVLRTKSEVPSGEAAFLRLKTQD